MRSITMEHMCTLKCKQLCWVSFITSYTHAIAKCVQFHYIIISVGLVLMQGATILTASSLSNLEHILRVLKDLWSVFIMTYVYIQTFGQLHVSAHQVYFGFGWPKGLVFEQLPTSLWHQKKLKKQSSRDVKKLVFVHVYWSHALIQIATTDSTQ